MTDVRAKCYFWKYPFLLIHIGRESHFLTFCDLQKKTLFFSSVFPIRVTKMGMINPITKSVISTENPRDRRKCPNIRRTRYMLRSRKHFRSLWTTSWNLNTSSKNPSLCSAVCLFSTRKLGSLRFFSP